MSNESFVVAKRALCRCEQQNRQNSNHPILVDIGWLICIFEFTGQYWYLVICSKTSKDIQYMTSPNCRSFSASTSNSLDRRTASGWLPSSRASETHFFHLLCHYFFWDHHDWGRNHDWKLPWLFLDWNFVKLALATSSEGPHGSRVVSASKQQLPSLQVLDWSLAVSNPPSVKG